MRSALSVIRQDDPQARRMAFQVEKLTPDLCNKCGPDGDNRSGVESGVEQKEEVGCETSNSMG